MEAPLKFNWEKFLSWNWTVFFTYAKSGTIWFMISNFYKIILSSDLSWTWPADPRWHAGHMGRLQRSARPRWLSLTLQQKRWPQTTCAAYHLRGSPLSPVACPAVQGLLSFWDHRQKRNKISVCMSLIECALHQQIQTKPDKNLKFFQPLNVYGSTCLDHWNYRGLLC